MVNRQQGGIVLLTTMMMLMLLTVLVLSLMKSVFLYIKSSHQVIDNHQLFRQIEQISKTLDMRSAACVVQDKNPNQLIEMMSMNQGCLIVEGNHQYSYLLDDQGRYPCLQIEVDGILYGSQHWLLTIASMQPPNIILQLRVAKAIDTAQCELPMVHQIHAGVLSWRKLQFPLDRNKGRGKIFA